jgi:phosphatidylethanolamine/phosphatidyl-N-methylethanolamine N-methyltransferase
MNDFFQSDYRRMFYTKGIAAWATALIHKALEKNFPVNRGLTILEVGGGEGFHVPYVSPDFDEYVLLDLEERELDAAAKELQRLGKLIQVISDASDIPFADNSFDRVIFMCVLHHLEKIDSALLEARRITKNQGWISVYLPCDPGILYRFLRRIFTYRMSRKLSINYEVVNAFEHRNHIASLISILCSIYSSDKIEMSWRPFPVKFWNANIYCVVNIQKIS